MDAGAAKDGWPLFSRVSVPAALETSNYHCFVISTDGRLFAGFSTLFGICKIYAKSRIFYSTFCIDFGASVWSTETRLTDCVELGFSNLFSLLFSFLLIFSLFFLQCVAAHSNGSVILGTLQTTGGKKSGEDGNPVLYSHVHTFDHHSVVEENLGSMVGMAARYDHASPLSLTPTHSFVLSLTLIHHPLFVGPFLASGIYEKC